MLIKVTKKMVNMLNKSLDEKPIRFTYEESSPQHYERFVDWDLFKAYDHGDFDISKGVFRFIRCSYPAEYYALDRFLTTYDLAQIFRAGKYSDFDSFASAVFAEVEA